MVVGADENALTSHGVELRQVDNLSNKITTVTDDAGRFLFTSLSPGDYLLKTQPHAFFTNSEKQVRAGGGGDQS